MPVLNDADDVYVGTDLADAVITDAAEVWVQLYSAAQFNAIFTILQVVSTR